MNFFAKSVSERFAPKSQHFNAVSVCVYRRVRSLKARDCPSLSIVESGERDRTPDGAVTKITVREGFLACSDAQLLRPQKTQHPPEHFRWLPLSALLRTTS
jgi:hypothetical protein